MQLIYTGKVRDLYADGDDPRPDDPGLDDPEADDQTIRD